MKKCLVFLISIVCVLRGGAQVAISSYLDNHHYSFTLEKGFDKETASMLKERLANYRLIIQGEGGSHDLIIYNRLPVI